MLDEVIVGTPPACTALTEFSAGLQWTLGLGELGGGGLFGYGETGIAEKRRL